MYNQHNVVVYLPKVLQNRRSLIFVSSVLVYCVRNVISQIFPIFPRKSREREIHYKEADKEGFIEPGILRVRI